MNGTIASVGDIGGSTPTPTPTTYRLKISHSNITFYVDVDSNTITSTSTLRNYMITKGVVGVYRLDGSTNYESASIPCVPSWLQQSTSSNSIGLSICLSINRSRTTGAWSSWSTYVTGSYISDSGGISNITIPADGSGWSFSYV